ncbi:MAG: tetratricopeptide repeat protein [Pseudomonadota bacterium]
MAETDFWGNAITVSEPTTAAAVRDFSEGLIKFDRKAGGIIRAAKNDPGCAVANAYAAMLMMFLEMADSPRAAAPFLKAAEAGSGGVTDREKQIIACARHWVARDIPALVKAGKTLLDDHPSDLVMVKIRQTMQFDWGDAAGMLHSARYGVKAFPDAPGALGMLAFGQEESHLLAEAEATAWRAIELDRGEGWAQHALAHVMLTTGRIDEGRAFLTGMHDTWEGKNSVLYCHNWWHVALFAISQGDYDGALAVYDDHIHGVQPDYSQDQINEISLLARLEVVGCDIGSRWEGLAERLALRAGDFVTPFLSMQYLYALARAGRAEAGEMLTNLRAYCDGDAGWSEPVWRHMAIPACEGLKAHAEGDWEGAVAGLGRALPLIWQGGGSHAQRDVFHQIHLDALIRAGRYAEAQQVLMGRLGFEPDSVPNNRALAGVYGALGLPEEAAAAAAKARLN